MFRSVAISSLVLVALTASADEEADAYKIQWHGPSQVGQQRRLTSTLHEHSSTNITRGEKVIQDHTTRNQLEFEGIVSVLAVDDSGRATEVRVEVKKCLFRVGDDEPQPMLAAGTIVIGEAVKGRTVFRAENERLPLPHLAKASLAKLIAIAKLGPDEEAIFGDARKAKPGESWPADKKSLVEKFRELDANIAEDDVVGNALLDGISTEDGKRFIDLRFSMTATTDKPGNPPTSMEPVEAKIQVSGKLRFPADYETDWVEQSLKLNLAATYRGKPRSRAAGQTMRYESTRTIEAKAVYLKKKDEGGRMKDESKRDRCI